jgi:hypothetical protein
MPRSGHGEVGGGASNHLADGTEIDLDDEDDDDDDDEDEDEEDDDEDDEDEDDAGLWVQKQYPLRQEPCWEEQG